ncbi:MAG: sulfatase [Rikenellaceae bacterium]
MKPNFNKALPLGAILLASCATEEPIRPNILYIFPDQYRVQAMGFMEEDPVITPNIDRLASEGVVCYNAVSTSPLSSPYRGMLLTGKYPYSNHVVGNCNTYATQFGIYLREDEECISDVLKAEGYHCGYIGKWHLDAPEGEVAKGWQTAVWDTYTPVGDKRHGFDYWCSYGCHNQHLDPYYWEGDAPASDTTYAHKWGPIFEADKAIEFIEARGSSAERDKDKPWALFISMNPPHGPYDQVPQEYKDLYSDTPIEELMNRPNVPLGKGGDKGRNSVRDYFACVTGIDNEVGRILEALDRSGERDNTIVIFTADHGEMMGSHALMQKNVPYEESFRVPFILSWRGRLEHRKESLHIGVPDVMPTLLGLVGLNGSIPEAVEGEDYSSVILEESDSRPEYSLYIRPGEQLTTAHSRGLRTDRYTFVVEKSRSGEVAKYTLFDNHTDPFQMTNIADSSPELIKEFEPKLYARLMELNDPWMEGLVKRQTK